MNGYSKAIGTVTITATSSKDLNDVFAALVDLSLKYQCNPITVEDDIKLPGKTVSFDFQGDGCVMFINNLKHTYYFHPELINKLDDLVTLKFDFYDADHDVALFYKAHVKMVLDPKTGSHTIIESTKENLSFNKNSLTAIYDPENILTLEDNLADALIEQNFIFKNQEYFFSIHQQDEVRIIANKILKSLHPTKRQYPLIVEMDDDYEHLLEFLGMIEPDFSYSY